jgi:AGCS family alanine or glycine:cation symporter
LIDGDLLARLANLVWGQWTIALLVVLGIVMTVYSRGIQFRQFRNASRLVMQGALRRDPATREPGEISPFQALTTAMAATIGNGNIAGVATAIAIGGPGAAFWMAAIAPLGMATKYAETFFGIRYRREMQDGSMLGGPMVYLADGAGLKGLGFAFAACIALGAIGAGNLAQANSVTLVMYTQFAIPKWLSGLILAGVLATVIVGGIKRIGQVAERLVPTMVLLYVAGVLVTLVVNIEKVPAAFQLIVSSAFSPVAATGGFAGSTVARSIEYGIRRGVISSEAGLGSAGIAHSAARTSDPNRQGKIAMMGVFIDTVIVCMATALTVVVTGVWSNGEMSSAMVASAFNSSIPFGGSIIAICSLFFGFTSLVAWSYYGEQGLRYILGGRKPGVAYRILWCVLAFIGSIYGVKLIWDISDILIGLMVFPNIIGLLVLRRRLSHATRAAPNQPGQ